MCMKSKVRPFTKLKLPRSSTSSLLWNTVSFMLHKVVLTARLIPFNFFRNFKRDQMTFCGKSSSAFIGLFTINLLFCVLRSSKIFLV